MEEFVMADPPDSSAPPLPWLFFIVAIIVAVAVGTIIAYLGVTGHLGAGVPGSKGPAGGLTFIPLLGLISGASGWVMRRRIR